MNLAAVPTTADEKRKYDNLVVQYEYYSITRSYALSTTLAVGKRKTNTKKFKGPSWPKNP